MNFPNLPGEPIRNPENPIVGTTEQLKNEFSRVVYGGANLPLGAPASLSGLRDLIERRKEPGYRPFPIN